jgi:hypothetical protein
LKQLLRRLLIGLTALIALMALGAVILTKVIDPNQYRSSLESLAMDNGVELAIAGDLDWQLLPLGIQVNRVNFALLDQSMAGEFEQLTVGISLLTLIAFDYERNLPISNFSVSNGRLLFALPDSLPLQFSNIQLSSQQINTQGELFPVSVSLQAPKGLSLSFESEIGLSITNQSLTSLALADFTLRLNKLHIGGDIEATNNLSEIRGNLTAKAFNLLDQFKLIKKFVPDLYIPQPVDTKALTEVALNSQFTVDLTNISQAQTTLIIDGQTFDIEVVVDQPSYKLTTLIYGDDFDLGAYLPKASSTANNGMLFAPLAIPLAVWHGQSQMELHLNQLTLDDLTVANIYANLFGNQSVFKLTSFNADIFDGQVDATATLNLQSSVANFNAQTTITNLDLGAMLDIETNTGGMDGILALDANIQSSGNQIETIIKSLAGDGSLSLTSPIYKGINLEQRFCEAARLFSSSPLLKQQWPLGTQLDDLTANFRIKNGRLMIKDYQTAVGNVALSGDSTIDLSNGKYTFNATGLLNQSKTSKTGCAVSKLLQKREIPFICEGKFSEKANCRPDNKLLNSLIQKP